MIIIMKQTPPDIKATFTWNRTQKGTDRFCVYTGTAGTVPNRTASRTQMGPPRK